MRSISYSDIINRQSFLIKEYHEDIDKNCDLYYERFADKNDLENRRLFINECAKSTNSSNKYIREIMDIYNELEDDLKLRVETSVIPRIYEENFIKGNPNIDKIIENNHICDRILYNHRRIKEKNNLESFVRENRYIEPEILINMCCEAVSSTNIIPRGKVIISIEEFFYLANRFGIEYNDQAIIESALSYHVFKYGTESIVNEKMNKALNKNVVMEYESDYTGIECIEYFKIAFGKNTELLTKTVSDVLDNIQSIYSVKKTVEELFKLFREIIISSNDDELVSSVYNTAIPSFYSEFYNRFIEDTDAKNYIEIIINCLYEEAKLANCYITDFKDPIVSNLSDITVSRFTHYLTAINDCLDKFRSMFDSVYNKYNIESMMYVNLSESKKSPKIFKQQNLINLVYKVDKFIANKFKNIKLATKAKIKELKNKIFLSESTELFEIVDEEGYIDFVYEVYSIENTDAGLNTYLSNMCKEANDKIFRGSCYLMYHVTLEDTVEFHIKSIDNYQLTEEDTINLESYLSDYELSCLYELSEIDKGIIVPNYNDILEFCNNNDKDTFYVFRELASYAGIDEDIMFNICALSGYQEIGYKVKNISLNTQLEAVNLLSEMIYEDAQAEEKEVKSGPITGVNLNNIKLAIEGLKKKAKDLSSKEQSLSRQADVTFNMFINSMKKALVSDRREAIIKGSVIPSFSRCIKIIMLLIGAGIVTKSFAVPIIAAIGALGVSKRLTKKERTLLLDDIEIELEVLEKEIQIADSKNQMKKLRALMRTKKDLQRQYQRIKYNTRIGKDLLPSSTGVEVK